jgi:hypothetical protein
MTAAQRKRVARRARWRCEYCLIALAKDQAIWQVDHIIAGQHRRDDRLSNLAAACAYCNAHKGPNLAGIDPRSRRIVRLFHPRTDEWREHFPYDGSILVGLSDIARATVQVLAINHPSRVRIRTALATGR